jgi:trafficking protein particle complex subunit 13
MSATQPSPLVFRVMRLARPSLAYDNCLRVDLIEDMGPDRPMQPSMQSSLLPASLMSAYAERVQLPSAVDCMNVTGLLQLPDSFGRVYLGEV